MTEPDDGTGPIGSGARRVKRLGLFGIGDETSAHARQVRDSGDGISK